MHFHIDQLNARSLATVLVVSLVWHSGERLVGFFNDHQKSVSLGYYDTRGDSLGYGYTAPPNYFDTYTPRDNGGYIDLRGNKTNSPSAR